jgi:hypothetical protein
MANVWSASYGSVNTLSNVIAGTGAQTFLFCLPVSASQDDWSLWVTVTDPTAVPTTVTADLEASFDGAVTWQKVATALALVATSVATAQKVLNCPTGVPLRFNVTTFTVGSATGPLIKGVIG